MQHIMVSFRTIVGLRSKHSVIYDFIARAVAKTGKRAQKSY